MLRLARRFFLYVAATAVVPAVAFRGFDRKCRTWPPPVATVNSNVRYLYISIDNQLISFVALLFPPPRSTRNVFCSYFARLLGVQNVLWNSTRLLARFASGSNNCQGNEEVRIDVASLLATSKLCRRYVWESKRKGKNDRRFVIALKIPLENRDVSIRWYLHEDPRNTTADGGGSKYEKCSVRRRISEKSRGKGKSTLVESGHIVKWNK